MQIKTLPIRDFLGPSSELAERVSKLVHVDRAEIPQWTDFEWHFPKCDLSQFVPVLNRFDRILSSITDSFEIREKVQTAPFTPETKELILSIVNCTGTLFDNCTNQKIYNSAEHISYLLFSTDLDIVEAALRLLIKLALRRNKPSAPDCHFYFVKPALLELAKGIPINKVFEDNQISHIPISYEAHTLNKLGEEQKFTIEDFVVPGEAPDDDLFWEVVKRNDYRPSSHLDLLTQIRVANHANEPQVKKQLLIIRLLSLGVLAQVAVHTCCKEIIAYEKELVNQICQLLTSSDQQISVDIRTCALYALSGLADDKVRADELSKALNISANHGILLHILRQLCHENSSYTADFVNAFFSLLSALIKSENEATFVSAGIIPALVQTLTHHENRDPVYLKTIYRGLDTLHLILKFGSFSIFDAANGLAVLLGALQFQVDSRIEDFAKDKPNNYNSLTFIKCSLRFIHYLLKSESSADSVRNLVETNFPHLAMKILNNPQIFRPRLFALVLSVTSAFIHIEPTSLSIFQEIGVPQTFFEVFESYDEPTYEVLEASIDTFSALCLNSTGLDMAIKSNSLPRFFYLLFKSDLTTNKADLGRISLLGKSMDEFIRHQPSLKPIVYGLVQAFVKGMIGQCKLEESKPVDDRHILVRESKTAVSDNTECKILSHVELTSRFLEGFLQNSESTRSFIENNGTELLLEFYNLPFLPYNYPKSSAFYSLNGLFLKLFDVSQLRVTKAVARQIHIASRFLFTDLDSSKSVLYEFSDTKDKTDEFIEKGDKLMHQLTVLFGYTELFSYIFCYNDCYNRKGYRSIFSWMSKKKEEYKNVIYLLGEIHRVLVWQNILFRDCVPALWYSGSVTVLKILPEVNEKSPQLKNIRRFKFLLAEIIPTTTKFFKKVFTVICIKVFAPPKLSVAAHVKQISKDFAVLFKQNLNHIASSESDLRFDYYSSMFAMALMLLIGDKSKKTINAPFVVAFEEAGNTNFLLFDLLPKFWEIIEHNAVAKDNQKSNSKRVNTCTELLLTIMYYLACEGLFNEAQESSILNFPYRGTLDSPVSFNHRYWITFIKLKINNLNSYLSSPNLSKIPKSILALLLKCITQSISESRIDSGSYIDQEIADQIRDFETNRRALVSMGFPSAKVEKALGNHYIGLCALEILFSESLVRYDKSKTPVLEISKDLVISSPLTDAERHASIKILTNMRYDNDVASKAMEEYPNIVDALKYLRCQNDLNSHTSSLSPDDKNVDVVENTPGKFGKFDELDDFDLGSQDGAQMSDALIASKEKFFSVPQGSFDEILLNKDMYETRKRMRNTIPCILSDLVDERSDVDFEVRDLMIALCCPNTASFEENSKEAIILFFTGISKSQNKDALLESSIKKVHIFALMLRQPVMRELISVLISLMSGIINWDDTLENILLGGENIDPKWHTTLFWVVEVGLAEADEPKIGEPRTYNSDLSDDLCSPMEGLSAIDKAIERDFLLDNCINYLRRDNLNQDNLIATLRVLVRLTKRHDAAVSLVYQGGLEVLFKRLRTSFEALKVQQIYIIMILRHIIESKAGIINCMFEALFSSSKLKKGKSSSALSFLKYHKALVLREPECFLRAAVRFWRPVIPTRSRPKGLEFYNPIDEANLKSDVLFDNFTYESSNLTKKHISCAYEDIDISDSLNFFSLISTEEPKDVITFLMNQIYETQKSPEDTSIKWAYLGFLIQCTLEIVSSYPLTKHIIIYNDKKTIRDLSVPKENLYRLSALYEIVDKILPYDMMSEDILEAQKIPKILSSNLALLICSICNESSYLLKESSLETQKRRMANVRDHILSIVYYLLKNTYESDISKSKKQDKYFVLSELIFSLLDMPTSYLPERNVAMAKHMLEKKYVPLLISITRDAIGVSSKSQVVLKSLIRSIDQLTFCAAEIDKRNYAEILQSSSGEDDWHERDYYLGYVIRESKRYYDKVFREARMQCFRSSLAILTGSVPQIYRTLEHEDDKCISSGEESEEESEEESDEESDEYWDHEPGFLESHSEHSDLDFNEGINEGASNEILQTIMIGNNMYRIPVRQDPGDLVAVAHNPLRENSENNNLNNEETEVNERNMNVYSSDSESESNHSFYEFNNGSTGSYALSYHEYEYLYDSINSDASDSMRSEKTYEVVWRLDDTYEGAQIEENHNWRDTKYKQIIQIEVMNEADENNKELGGFDLAKEIEATECYDKFVSYFKSHNHDDTLQKNDFILHPLLKSAESVAAPHISALYHINKNHLQAYEDSFGYRAVRVLEAFIDHQRTSDDCAADIEKTLINDTNTEAIDWAYGRKEAYSIMKNFSVKTTEERWEQELQMIYVPSVASSKAALLHTEFVEYINKRKCYKESPSDCSDYDKCSEFKPESSEDDYISGPEMSVSGEDHSRLGDSFNEEDRSGSEDSVNEEDCDEFGDPFSEEDCDERGDTDSSVSDSDSEHFRNVWNDGNESQVDDTESEGSQNMWLGSNSNNVHDNEHRAHYFGYTEDDKSSSEHGESIEEEEDQSEYDEYIREENMDESGKHYNEEESQSDCSNNERVSALSAIDNVQNATDFTEKMSKTENNKLFEEPAGHLNNNTLKDGSHEYTNRSPNQTPFESTISSGTVLKDKSNFRHEESIFKSFNETSDNILGGDAKNFGSTSPYNNHFSPNTNVSSNPNEVTDSTEGDIENIGLDPEFLKALPQNLRNDLLKENLQHNVNEVDDEPIDHISPEFLAALPDDLREDIVQEEVKDRELRQNSRSPSQGKVLPNHIVLFPNKLDPDTSMKNIERAASLSTVNFRYFLDVKEDQEDDSPSNELQILEKEHFPLLYQLLISPKSESEDKLKRTFLSLCKNRGTSSETISIVMSAVCALGESYKSSDINDTEVQANAKVSMDVLDAQNTLDAALLRTLNILASAASSEYKLFAYFLEKGQGIKRYNFNDSSDEVSQDTTPKLPILDLIDLLNDNIVKSKDVTNALLGLIESIVSYIPSLTVIYEREHLENESEVEKSNLEHLIDPVSIPTYYLDKVLNILSKGRVEYCIFEHTISILSYVLSLDGVFDYVSHRLVELTSNSVQQLLKDLDDLYSIFKDPSSEQESKSLLLNTFSDKNSSQVKLLSYIIAIDSLYGFQPKMSYYSLDKNRIVEMYNELNLEPLWEKLDRCLSQTQDNQEIIDVIPALLPSIESFLVVYKSNEKTLAVKSARKPTSEKTGKLFLEKHKKLLNFLVRSNPFLLKGPFSVLLNTPSILEFDNKKMYFQQQLKNHNKNRSGNNHKINLVVRRKHVFEDTFKRLRKLSGRRIQRGKIFVEFLGEDGYDEGGLSREWFSILSRQMFDPSYALFVVSSADKLTYQPNSASGINPEHLEYFKTIGRIIGKAISDRWLLDAYFTRLFYKLILGGSVDYRDIEAFDPTFYKSLVWMLENDITDVIDLNFSVEVTKFGTTETIDLKPNGRQISVTEENKHEYVSLMAEQKLYLSIKEQVKAFIEGFTEIIPRQFIQIFNEQELELLISGLPDIDVDDWKAHTILVGYKSSSPIIQWFWRAVRSFNKEERAKLLQFSTGTSKVPLEGFSQLQGSNGVQKFQIHKEFGNINRLPSAHTCFNQIDLPQYLSYEDLRSNLFKAITECTTGFAFS